MTVRRRRLSIIRRALLFTSDRAKKLSSPKPSDGSLTRNRTPPVPGHLSRDKDDTPRGVVYLRLIQGNGRVATSGHESVTIIIIISRGDSLSTVIDWFNTSPLYAPPDKPDLVYARRSSTRREHSEPTKTDRKRRKSRRASKPRCRSARGGRGHSFTKIYRMYTVDPTGSVVTFRNRNTVPAHSDWSDCHLSANQSKRETGQERPVKRYRWFLYWFVFFNFKF